MIHGNFKTLRIFYDVGGLIDSIKLADERLVAVTPRSCAKQTTKRRPSQRQKNPNEQTATRCSFCTLYIQNRICWVSGFRHFANRSKGIRSTSVSRVPRFIHFVNCAFMLTSMVTTLGSLRDVAFPASLAHLALLSVVTGKTSVAVYQCPVCRFFHRGWMYIECRRLQTANTCLSTGWKNALDKHVFADQIVVEWPMLSVALIKVVESAITLCRVSRTLGN